MRVLYLTLEPPLNAGAVATGNQLRAAMLEDALSGAGHEVIRRVDEHWTGPDLKRRIGEARPDVVLLGYWQIAEFLPDDLQTPVVVDCIALRPLEDHFVDPLSTPSVVQRYTRALSRADLMLVGNARQRILLAGWLLAAGQDLRSDVPIAELPLAVTAPERARSEHSRPLVFATGGKDWPWRNASTWLTELVDSDDAGAIELHHFGSRDLGVGAIEHGLAAWQDWQAFLSESAHVGVELADRNLERELAQPFRIASFLQAGLPLLVNDYLPISELVRKYKAGWVVDSPQAARQAVSEALEEPEQWRERARGVRRLALECFDLEASSRPLLKWLEAPRKRYRTTSSPPNEPQSAEPEAQPSLLGMIARPLLSPIRRDVVGDGVVIVTRSDLFPTDHGAAVKIVETARGLARTGRPVAIVTAERSRYWLVREGGVEARLLPWWLRPLALPAALTQAMHRLRGLPASNAFLYWALYDPSYGLRAAWVGRAIGASTVLAEFPAYAQSARICRLFNGGRAVLAEHNVEYLRLAEQVPNLSATAFEKLRKDELKLANSMDAVVCVSDRDRAQLIADGMSPGRQLTIPHGVNLTAFETAAPTDLAAVFGLDPKRPVLVYHGTFSYSPNRQALLILVDKLLPRLERLGHRVQVLGIGREPPPGVDHPDVHLPGSVADLTGPLKACDLAVVPLVSGGGTRMKILDYFAAGLPVISTSKGCEGLPIADGEQLLVRDDWDAFARAAADLLENADRRSTLGAAGHELARSLSWQEIAGRYDRLFRKLA